MSPNFSHRGFSLVEMLVAVGIMTFIATISFVSYSSYSKKEALEAGAVAIASTLRDARAQTLASVGGNQYGVAVATSSVTFFTGAVYSPSAATNKQFILSSYVNASSSRESYVFQRITGNPVASGTIDVYLAGNGAQKRVITVSLTGLVDIQK